MELHGIASIALLPSGSISGHFVHPPSSACIGLYGTEIPCARECSRAEDFRLIKLTLLDYKTKKETDVIVECRGQDALRFKNVDDVHGWEKDAVGNKELNNKVKVCFECETLKSDDEAERHLQKYLPAQTNKGAIVNTGTMKIEGLELDQPAAVKQDDEHREEQALRPITPEAIDPDFTLQGKVVEVKSMDQLHLEPGPESMTDEIGKLLEEELQAEGLVDSPVEFAFSWKDHLLNPSLKVNVSEDLDETDTEESAK